MEEQHKSTATKKRKVYYVGMDEGRKRVSGIIAGIIMARNLDRADDLFGGPQGSPRTDNMIAAAVQWATQLCGRSITSRLNRVRIPNGPYRRRAGEPT
jgi:hypothetical protein